MVAYAGLTERRTAQQKTLRGAAFGAWMSAVPTDVLLWILPSRECVLEGVGRRAAQKWKSERSAGDQDLELAAA